MIKKALLIVTALPVIHSGAFAAMNVTFGIADSFEAGDSLHTDGWSGSGWTASSFENELYSRNDVGAPPNVDRTIYRPNDTTFSYTIPDETTSLELSFRARSGSNFWEAGLADGNSRLFGVGGDFVFGNEYYVLDGTARFYETGETAVGDQMTTITLTYDFVEGVADLATGEAGNQTIIRSDIPLTTTLEQLQQADGLFIRTDTEFAGLSSLSITTVPEPAMAAWSLGLLGLMMVGLRRRR
jgi:MYXO-CTERM domain-containing protein